jgi:adenylate cyclase
VYDHDVFVSYAREDRAFAEALVTALRASDWRVWWDDQIRAGSKFDAILDQALNDAACVVVLWSRHSVASEWVKMEAQYGLARERLLPVFIENVDLPQPFHRLHTANLTKWTGSDLQSPEFQRLLIDVYAIVETQWVNPSDTAVPGFGEQSAVAVLPFENQAHESDVSYLGEAIAEDLIRRLQAFRTLPVIARHSSFAYRGRSFDLKRIARELRVGYLVTGNVRKLGNRIRIAVELTETLGQRLIWSVSLTRDAENLFDLQDEISIEIASRIEPEVGKAERQRYLPTHKDSMSTWQLLRRAQYHQFKLGREDAALAREYIAEALRQEPDSVDALCVHGWQVFWDISARHAHGDAWEELRAIGQRILAIDPEESRGLDLLGIATMMGGQPLESRPMFEQAVELNPSNAWALSNLGSTYYLCGEPERGIDPITKALRLSPFDLFAFHAHGELAHCYFLCGKWDDALRSVGRSLQIRRNYWLAHVLRIAILARADRLGEARAALKALIEQRPKFSMHDIRWIAYAEESQFDYLIESLELAGWVRREKGDD